jgi:putative ATP-dependent endonuclease of OLD family
LGRSAGPSTNEPKFEEVVRVFEQVEGFPKFKTDFARFFNEMQADTNAKLAIDFKPYTPSNYFKTMQIVAQDAQVGDRFDLEELGDGSRNMVLLALLRSYAENFRNPSEALHGVLALEEPELYMHPQARRHLFKVLRDIASSGMQVIISTHSASFIETEFFDSIGRVVKVEDDESPGRSCTDLKIVPKRGLVARCKATGVPDGKATVENIGEFYKTTSNPMLNEAFFARFLILVEGDTEELALPVLLAKVGIDCDLLGISIISVRGKPQVPKYWRLFTAFDIPTLAVVDNDVGGKDARGSNSGLVSCFGFDLEEILAVDVCRRFDEDEKHLLVLEQDYEHALRKDFGDFGQVEQLDEFEKEARELIKPVGDQNKGQMARHVARRLCEAHPDFAPKFVTMIAELLREHGISRPSVAEPEAEPEEIDDEIPF